MGDRSPKDTKKQNDQKKAKHDSSDAKKKANADAKRAPATKKK